MHVPKAILRIPSGHRKWHLEIPMKPFSEKIIHKRRDSSIPCLIPWGSPPQKKILKNIGMVSQDQEPQKWFNLILGMILTYSDYDLPIYQSKGQKNPPGHQPPACHHQHRHAQAPQGGAARTADVVRQHRQKLFEHLHGTSPRGGPHALALELVRFLLLRRSDPQRMSDSSYFWGWRYVKITLWWL